MKKNLGKYDEVKTLPAHAEKVSLYAKNKNIGVPWFYKSYAIASGGGRPVNFKIILFQGSNYVVPKPERVFKKEIKNYELSKIKQ